MSPVSAVPAADSGAALAHFSTLLSFETDCADVHASLESDDPLSVDFVLLDVRSPEAYEQGHVPGAVNLPHRRIAERTLSDFPEDALYVVYCSGPHCNGADRAAVRLARLGRKVKKMIGGAEGWKVEGFALEKASSEESVGHGYGRMAPGGSARAAGEPAAGDVFVDSRSCKGRS